MRKGGPIDRDPGQLGDRFGRGPKFGGGTGEVGGASVPCPMKPLCEICGDRHESYQAHVFKNYSATNADATNTKGATNRERGLPDRGAGRVDCSEPVVEPAGTGSSGAGKTKNRRSRESYNAYQREYMRKRRQK
jgi:hypothetical protein